MAEQFLVQPNFSRGVLSKVLRGRVDIDHYKAALLASSNFVVMKQGGLRKRAGSMMVREVKDSSKKVRLLPFVFGNGQGYLIELGDLYFRPTVNAGVIRKNVTNITSATQANPVVIGYSGADVFTNGMRIYITGVVGMTQLNNREFTVAGVNTGANTLQLSGVNGTGYDAYSSGGTVGEVTEFATPWPEAEVYNTDFAQSNDVLTVVHRSYPIREIARTNDTTWAVTIAELLDGPYDKEPTIAHASLTFSGTGNLIPDMTSDTLPSGTASATGIQAGFAFNAMDRDDATAIQFQSSVVASLAYDFAGATTKRAVGYTIRARRDVQYNGLGKWRVEGFDGTNWVPLDNQVVTEGWNIREKRFFEMPNENAWQSYRITIDAPSNDQSSDDRTSILEWTLTEHPDDQTPMTMTASSTAGINNGAGFSANDIGRLIRIKGRDGLWRHVEIVGNTSSTVCTVVLRGAALEVDGETITKWQLGAFHGPSIYPQAVALWQERRVFGYTDERPMGVFGSKSQDFYDFGVSSPLLADDGFSFDILGKQIAPIQWLKDSDDLILGTLGGIRTLGPSNTNEGFSATNFKQRQRPSYAASRVKPVDVGGITLYVDLHKRTIREFYYDFQIDNYVSPDLTILSDDLLKKGIVDMAFQQDPNSIVWIVTVDGKLLSLTYERDQRIAALMPHDIAIGDPGTTALVESVAVVPGAVQDDVYIAVKRTIGGVTRRYIEKLADDFPDDGLTADMCFLDSYLQYSGAAVGTIGGLMHLNGRTVRVLADGNVMSPDPVVTNGKVTLPGGVTAAKWTVGLAYGAYVQTLPLANAADGSWKGRKKTVNQIGVDVVETLGITIGHPNNPKFFDLIFRETSDPTPGPLNRRTGLLFGRAEGSWRDDAQCIVRADQPYNAVITAIEPVADGEP